jgi:hypothetical protein
MTTMTSGSTPRSICKDVSKFYIATDNDDKGEIVADKIAQRLGRYRCVRVLFEEQRCKWRPVGGGMILVKESILNGKRYPASGTYTIEDLQEVYMICTTTDYLRHCFQSTSFG